MTRRAIIPIVIAAAAVVALVALGSGGEDKHYQVRAIFRNASFTIPGEDVKIGGARVGQVDHLDVTPDGRAAVVLNIDDPGFQDFRQDAECSIRLQSVIGEKLVECQPTQPRPEGTPPPPPLKEIPSGQPGAGQHLLPVSQTVTPIDVDLINDIQRLPYRQRLTILLNEFGTGLAGRGEDLRQAIRSANPALRELDRVIKILADQNRTLRDLAVNGDRVLSEWAKKRKQTADFIVQANTVAQATAERGDDLEQNFARFPAFLRELKPTMERLGALSDEMTPVVTDLGAQGSDVSRFLIDLGPFARYSNPALRTLGDTADVGGPALETVRPLVGLIAKFASKSRPLGANLKKLALNLRETETIQRAMDVIYFAALATNGYDSFGHYFRTALLSDCTAYRTKQVPNSPCNAKFAGGSTSTSTGTTASGTGISSTGQGPAGAKAAAPAGSTPLARILTTPSKPDQAGSGATSPVDRQAAGATTLPASDGASRTRRLGNRSQRAMLDYLLGGETR